MRIDHESILKQTFLKRFMGYDRNDVDTYLQILAKDFKEMENELEQLQRENAQKNELIRKLRTEVQAAASAPEPKTKTVDEKMEATRDLISKTRTQTAEQQSKVKTEVQALKNDIQRLKEDPLMLILDRTVRVPRASKAGRAVLIGVGVVIVAATGLLPIMVSALCGVGLMLLTRCLAWHEVWAALDTKLVMLIVASLALGGALIVTGAVEYIAAVLVSLVRDLPPSLILCGLLLLFSLLTEVVTNNSVAVLGTPIAINIAQNLGLPEIPFVLTVLFGANMSFMTPIGYQTNLLVISAGGYRFSDFFRAGMPLQILMWLTLSVVLTIWYL